MRTTDKGDWSSPLVALVIDAMHPSYDRSDPFDLNDEDRARLVVEAVLTYRDQHFGPGNDKVWGEGQWVRCERCIDGAGFPSYHHRDHHGAAQYGGSTP